MDDFRKPQSANEAILQNILGAENELRAPQSVIEELLIQISEMSGGSSDVLVPWLNGTITEIKAADLRGVSAIDYGAFRFCVNLESVSIPKSVKQMFGAVFSYCKKLKNVKLHDEISYIGEDTFLYCESLESFAFPKAITSVQDNFFSNCTKIKHIELKENVREIRSNVIYNCKNLESIVCRAVTPPRLWSGAFERANDTFKIYVPSQSVEAYKSAAEWSNYADRIFAITE